MIPLVSALNAYIYISIILITFSVELEEHSDMLQTNSEYSNESAGAIFFNLGSYIIQLPCITDML